MSLRISPLHGRCEPHVLQRSTGTATVSGTERMRGRALRRTVIRDVRGVLRLSPFAVAAL